MAATAPALRAGPVAALSAACALTLLVVSGAAPALAGGNLEAVVSNGTQIADAVWSARALPITWKINAQGAINNCDDGNPLCVGGVSPLTLQRAIDGMTQAFTAWQNISTSTIAFSYTGTTTQTNIGLDNVRLITWADSNPNTCGTGTVATTPSSRLAAALTVSDANRDLNTDGIVDLDPAIYPNGTVLPAGTIVDADMAWCPAANDYVDVPVDHPATFDIVAVGTHEIGHFHGLSHSPLIAPIATMLPFVEGTVVYQNDIRVLAQDDIIASSRFYPDPGSATGWGTIFGRLLLSDLATGADGVSVTAIDRRTGQEVAEVISVSRFTASADLPGSFRIDRLPPGDYAIAVEYFDGTATAEFDAWWDNNRYNTTVFNSNVSGGQRPLEARPEFWNSGESASDDLAAAETVTIAAGETRDLGSIAINTVDPPAPAGWTPLNMPNGVITQVVFPAGFTFPFYGQSYGSAYVSDNSNVAFGFAQDPSSHTGNFLGPNPVGGGAVPPRIGLPMTNLDPGVDNRGGRGGALDVFSRAVNDAAGERAEILFLGVPMIDTQKNNTVILRLFRSGRVEIDSRFVSAWWGIVGVSPGGPGPAPGVELDFSQALSQTFSGAGGQAVYEHFEFIQSPAVGGRNLLSDAYDLNGSLLVFVPNGSGGYDVSSPNFATLAPPAAEVPGLRFVDASGLAWDTTAGAVTYNVYRGGIPGLVDTDADGAAQTYGTCLQTGLAVTSANDPTVPPIDQAFFYLVTAVNAGGDGPIGFASSNAPRPNTAPCL